TAASCALKPVVPRAARNGSISLDPCRSTEPAASMSLTGSVVVTGPAARLARSRSCSDMTLYTEPNPKLLSAADQAGAGLLFHWTRKPCGGLMACGWGSVSEPS